MKNNLPFCLAPAIALAMTGCNDAALQKSLYDNGSQSAASYVSDFNSTDEEIYIQEFDTAYVRILEAGTFKRAAIAVHRAALLGKVGLLMA